MRRMVRRLGIEPVHGAIGYQLPDDAYLLHVDTDEQGLAMWWLYDADQPLVTREFFVALESMQVPDWVSFGSFLHAEVVRTGKGFVAVHVFQRLPE